MPEDSSHIQRGPKRLFGVRKKLKKDIEHVTKEMYKKNLELFGTNQTLSLLRTIDGLVLESKNTIEATCSQISNAVTSMTSYPLAAIFACRPQHKDELRLYGLSIKDNLLNHELADAKNAKIQIDSHVWLTNQDKSKYQLIDKLASKQVGDFLACQPKTLTAIAEKSNIKSVYCIKLMAHGKLAGIFVVGLGSQDAELSTEEGSLLDRLGNAIGVALDNKLLYEENQLVLDQLQKSNIKLKELDETKDEFIGMASHQLRTPLTSMKGYVSMVLDGDADKITDAQRKLLDQAFISSQRMVYMIADLLNVSRLKTGKFIIESKSTDLSKVVKEEIDQLTETAKGRKLTLTYDKPTNFPVLMLDETKIRQVIMNFIDNAIHYTPDGGHIHIHLEDKGTTVEFRVEDDGLGVPKADQPQLFNKFYRASNAQKARPDGIGLGLFMAKKVIAAQDGVILFNSDEGKGSVFGFSFSKDKLKVPTTK